MGYTKNAISGFSWQTFLKVVTIGLGMFKLMILARILTPADFGLFSLVTISLGIAEATTETGVNYTIINSKQSIKYFLNTAWVIAIVRGFIIGLLMVLSAFVLARFYEEERLLFLISLASLVPVIKGFINPAIVTLRKELHFFKESSYHLVRIISEMILAISITLIT
jgi:O-antigen/teichoic acid export membrane protein